MGNYTSFIYLFLSIEKHIVDSFVACCSHINRSGESLGVFGCSQCYVSCFCMFVRLTLVSFKWTKLDSIDATR